MYIAIVYTTPERHDVFRGECKHYCIIIYVARTAYYYYTKHARGILNR